MKKLVLIGALLLGLLFSGCTRKGVDKPDMNDGAGRSYNLTCTASPSTLYIPQTNPAVYSDVNVRVTDYKGNPLANGTVVFTHGGYGYFDSLQTSVRKTTNSSGVVTVRYYLPAGTTVANEATMNIVATLVDDGRLDSALSPIVDSIPMKIIPYSGTSTLVLSGHVQDSNGTGIEGAIIELSNNGGVTLTRSSGSYEISVARGWSGTVSAKKGSSAFSPANYNLTNVSQSMTGLDFIAEVDPVVIVLSRTAITVPKDGSGEKDGVDGMVYYEVFAREQSGKTGTWYTAKSDSSWIQITGGALNDTPHHFHFKVTGENTTGSNRVGNIIVTPLASKYGEPSGTPATLVVTQSAADATYSLTTGNTNLTMPESSTLDVTIGDTNDNFDYTINSPLGTSNPVVLTGVATTPSTVNNSGVIRLTADAVTANTTVTITVTANGAQPLTLTVIVTNI